jgi:hypothetical protein
MQRSVVPMLHVLDVRATVEWYCSVAGFTQVRVHEDGGEMLWALLRYGNADVMLNVGGRQAMPGGARWICMCTRRRVWIRFTRG